jgi:Ca2+-binding RTX toxin-like protein
VNLDRAPADQTREAEQEAAMRITGTLSADILRGGAEDDFIVALDGNDRLYGGEGNDRLYAGQGDDYLEGGIGDDTLYGDKERSGPNRVSEGGHDVLFGGAGNDQLHGEGGDDDLFGESGTDYLNGGDGEDVLWGGEGDDGLSGGNDHDNLLGGAGNDFLDGGAGSDNLYGGAGDDDLHGGDHPGGFGGLVDEPDLLSGGDGNDTLTGGVGDLLYGGADNDTLYGGSSPYNEGATLYGEGGNDTLEGGLIMDGGDGVDFLFAAEGVNALYGGTGDDAFVFRHGTTGEMRAGEADTIHDFDDADVIIIQGEYTFAGATQSPGEDQYSIWREPRTGDWVVTWNSSSDEGFHDLIVHGDNPRGDIVFIP